MGRCLLSNGGYCHVTSLDTDPKEIKDLCDAAGVKISALSSHSDLLDPEFGVLYARRGIRYAKAVGPFRSSFEYNNILFLLAGQVIPAVTGMRCNGCVESVPRALNESHGVDDANVARVRRDERFDDSDGIVLGDEVVQVLGKQRALVPSGTRDESLHEEHYAAELPSV